MNKIKGSYQRMAWYVPANSGFCRLVPLDEDMFAQPTDAQQGLVVCPDDNPEGAGHWFGHPDGHLLNLN